MFPQDPKIFQPSLIKTCPLDVRDFESESFQTRGGFARRYAAWEGFILAHLGTI